MITILVDENEKIVAFATDNSINASEGETKHAVSESELPTTLDKLYKYCYSGENGFYPNPNYEEEIPPEDEPVDYDEIALDHEFRISMLELGI